MACLRPAITEIDENKLVVQRRLADGDRSIVKQSAETRHGFDLEVGKIMGRRIRSW